VLSLGSLNSKKLGVRHFSRFSRSGYPQRWRKETSYAAYIGLFHHSSVVSAITAAAGLGNYARAMRHHLHRYYGAGDLHFITCSCYRRQPRLGTARRRDLLLKVLEQVRKRYVLVVVGYVVMPEHIHLLLSEPQEKNLSVVMQALKLGFARRVLAGAAPPPSVARQSFRACAATHLAETVLRFQRLDGKKARRETPLPTRESGAAGLGGISGVVEVEQLSGVPLR